MSGTNKVQSHIYGVDDYFYITATLFTSDQGVVIGEQYSSKAIEISRYITRALSIVIAWAIIRCLTYPHASFIQLKVLETGLQIRET